MIPLKVSWWRRSARLQICQAWIAVQLGLHRKAPLRIRHKLTKAADAHFTSATSIVTNYSTTTTIKTPTCAIETVGNALKGVKLVGGHCAAFDCQTSTVPDIRGRGRKASEHLTLTAVLRPAARNGE
ncbi:hypothetical protein PoB_006090400 [Plakobranchus ocellatus]|uniref:Secreted protein n=1 Tax=Plakobranchus ocellatus TaxID=259542 RepID=A0AAV4CR74_9GAST|nr:hypothetical protein PoB_006090400 [Plakobranchus ocellatus]